MFKSRNHPRTQSRKKVLSDLEKWLLHSRPDQLSPHYFRLKHKKNPTTPDCDDSLHK